MFITLMLKEIHESVMSFRFWLVSLLCLLLIPFGLYIASKDYQSRLEEYNRDQNGYLDNAKGDLGYYFSAKGFFPPSPLSIIAGGLKDYLPYKAETSHDGFVNTEKKLQDSNLQSVLFGKIDFVFIITNFLSLLALIFTFGAVSTEKEQGTLKLVLANPVNRWKLILSKIIGNYIVFLVPFILSTVMGILVVQWSAGVNLLQGENLAVLLIVILVTLVFLFMFFCLGIWASSISKSTVTSIVVLLFVWIFISMGIPRISPMVAQIINPVKTEDLFGKEYDAVKKQITSEYKNEQKALLEKLIAENKIDVQGMSMAELAKRTKYDELVMAVNQKYAQKLNFDLGNLKKTYMQDRDHQMMLASNLSRISPVSSFTFLTSELCGTGLLELNNCQEAAQKFQYSVTSDFYSNFLFKQYFFNNGESTSINTKDGIVTEKLSVPIMTQYKPVSLILVIKRIWPDFLLLMWYTIFFFTAAVVSFLRFDVR
jgi:ABC-type transport system involved in multi-copper enzyme maturation permease subunit